MSDGILFVVLTFIIIIVIILMAENLTAAMLIVSLIANFMVISTRFCKMGKNMFSTGLFENVTDKAPTVPNVEFSTETPDDSMYGNEYETWNAYRQSYTDCYKQINITDMPTLNIDSANVLLAQRRSRDKQCIDGAVSKDANYYKHHFAEELDQSESKPWWGRSEY